jgi:hypothetical protein
MSLGVSSAVEHEILQCLEEHPNVMPVQVAYWRYLKKLKPLLSDCEVATAMSDMEARGLIAFVEGGYVKS